MSLEALRAKYCAKEPEANDNRNAEQHVEQADQGSGRENEEEYDEEFVDAVAPSRMTKAV